LLNVLGPGRADANRVVTTLLEFDARNLRRARQFALNAGLTNVTAVYDCPLAKQHGDAAP
jgi:hypothetical protein